MMMVSNKGEGEAESEEDRKNMFHGSSHNISITKTKEERLQRLELFLIFFRCFVMNPPLSLPSPLLLGVSGGADSCYLLHLLMEQEHSNVIVCHVHHGLRGNAADEDQQFVRKLAESYELPFETTQVKLGEGAFEEEARKARLKFFSSLGEKYGTCDVALAHHADDQAETLLMNLCRGGQGLRGMSSPSELSDYGLTIWRPLLQVRKEEMILWLEGRALPWREDETNSEPIARRNRIRNEVIPLLNDVFQRDVTPLVLRGYEGQNEKLHAFSELLEHLDIYDPQGRLFLPKLIELSKELQSVIIHDYLKNQGIRDVSHEKITECLLLLSNQEVRKINLPGGKFLRRKEKRLFIEA